jgi:hypothetical protein
MKRVIYAVQFKGSAEPKDGAADLLVVTAAASGANVRTQVFPDGFDGKVEPESGDQAKFASTVKMLSESNFDEAGSISFGPGHSLRFVTAGQGHVAPTGEEGVSGGAVVWKVDGGEGRFAGATGYITSNFWFNAAGEVTDNQFGVIELQ